MQIILFDRELEVMQALWKNGPSTVPEVRERLDDAMAYNTVLTVLRRLEEKGFVGHSEEGRAYRYHALVQESQVQASAIDQLTRKLFGSSPAVLLTHLVSEKRLSGAEMRKLRALLDEHLPEKP